jgi:DNA-binding SARP family transcriptional activator/tetratricopeptide (TPR) repeat protein
VRLKRRQERLLLAILLLEQGRVVPAPRLCELLWEGNPPERARQSLHSHVARIRATFARMEPGEAVALASHRDGYLIQVDPDAVDAHRFRALLDEAATVSDLARRDELLRSALALWRGPALLDTASDWLRQRLCTELDELRMRALEDSMDTGLALGRHRELIPELARLAGENPGRERLTGQHMLALHRAGRTADALGAYTRACTHLAEQLGLSPGPELRQLHEKILREDPALQSPAPAVAVETQSVTALRPAQLPSDLAHFTGRLDHLRTLDELLANRDSCTAVVISALAGAGGVGKTALAVHWAHQVRDRFPDGQLYVNLRGFDPGAPAMTAAEALRGFLDALGVPPGRVPSDLHAQAGLYRSLLADRRVLVVLDNARDAEQVRALLPGTPGCAVLITSRHQLASLVATDGAHPLPLDLLTAGESRELLARRLGAARITAEPYAVEDIITSCARLPIALAIVSARAATHPGLTLAALAGELRQARGGLGAFTGDDAATDLRAVFGLSYRDLHPAAARLFRLLGLHPGPDIAIPAAASLAGVTAGQVRPLLAELTGAHLIIEHPPGRYSFHDLLRAYATELAHGHDPDPDRAAARHQILDHYLHAAHRAALLLDPHLPSPTLAEAHPSVTPEAVTDQAQALAWFAAERPVLLAAIGQAAGSGLHTHAWQLAWTLIGFLARRGHWRDLTDTQHTALSAARSAADPYAQAQAHRGIANAYTWLARHDEADDHFRQALDLFSGIGDRTGQADIHHGLAWSCNQQDRHSAALDHAQQALHHYRAAGDEAGQARALNAIGWHHSQLGDHQQALVHCQQALTFYVHSGDGIGQGRAWDSLGYAHHHLGEYQQAIACYHHALDLIRAQAHRHAESVTLINLGDTQLATGEPGQARAVWECALSILDDLDHPDADDVRTRLDALDQPRDGAVADPADVNPSRRAG